jgi:hypothetical protein
VSLLNLILAPSAETPDRAQAAHVLDFLETDLVAHVLDEEDDLRELSERMTKRRAVT